MKKIGLATATTFALVAGLTATAAPAQMGECIVVCHVYYNNTYSGGACRGIGGVCFSCYKICDNQPYPLDYEAGPGHLVAPQSQVALLDRNDVREDTHPRLGLAAQIAEAPASCDKRPSSTAWAGDRDRICSRPRRRG